MAQRLSAVLGRQFVVENKPGANGAIAANMVARAPADGYTLFQASLPQIAVVPAMSKAPYDPEKDLVPISMIAVSSFVLVVNKSMPVKTLAEFVDYVRARPTRSVLCIRKYRQPQPPGDGALPQARRSCDEPCAVQGRWPRSRGRHRQPLAGLFREFVRGASARRQRDDSAVGGVQSTACAQVPDVPTVAESGYPGFETLTWNGLMAPAPARQRRSSTSSRGKLRSGSRIPRLSNDSPSTGSTRSAAARKNSRP